VEKRSLFSLLDKIYILYKVSKLWGDGHMAEEKKEIGKVTHYFSKIGVSIIELSDGLKVGDKIAIEKGDVSFQQEVTSMHIEHDPVEEAKAGESVGLKVDQPAREGSVVYRIT